MSHTSRFSPPFYVMKRRNGSQEKKKNKNCRETTASQFFCLYPILPRLGTLVQTLTSHGFFFSLGITRNTHSYMFYPGENESVARPTPHGMLSGDAFWISDGRFEYRTSMASRCHGLDIARFHYLPRQSSRTSHGDGPRGRSEAIQDRIQHGARSLRY